MALQLDPAPKVTSASMLDGYLTAIVIGPCSIPPDEWFVYLLGERGRIASAADDVLAAIKTIVARFNAISEGLSIAPKQHAPLFEKTKDRLVLPQPWCMGFLSAMRLRFDDWGPLLDLNRIGHGLLLPICSTPPTSLGDRRLDRRGRGPKPKSFCAPRIRTSRS